VDVYLIQLTAFATDFVCMTAKAVCRECAWRLGSATTSKVSRVRAVRPSKSSPFSALVSRQRVCWTDNRSCLPDKLTF
jgi:hypothetical protein